MSGGRVPVPVWFAAAAFTMLLVEPEIGSPAAPLACAVLAAPVPASEAAARRDAGYWQGYRAASRQWSARNPIARRR